MIELNSKNRNGLPKDWHWIEVKNIAESIQYGYTESSSKEKVGPKFLRITDIQNGDVLWNAVPYCPIDADNKEKYLLKVGDLLFARTGATVGKSYLVKGNIPESVFASYLIRVRFKKGIIDKYIYNYFQSLYYWQQITDGQVGIGQPNVNGTKLGLLVVPMAPLNIQQQIVSKIEELFSELDKGVEELKTAQRQLKVYRQAVLKWAFEGRLTNEGVKDGELPDGWKRIELKDACIIKRGKSKHRPRNEPSLFGGKYPFIQTGDIRNANGCYISTFTQTYSEQGLQQSKLWPKGTLCITIAANIGETAILNFDACFPDSVVGLISKEEVLLTKYTNYFFIFYKSKLEEMAPATAQKNINVDILEKVKVPLCSIEEQHQIVQEIESRLSVCDNIEETITSSLKQAEALRQSILKKAFEGKLF
ncbi:restriction endonuclease subunit S [Flavisolibacter ginsengisoli]|jgi:type I restriction enzyme S subunit|uniref:Type I restriction enzyme, S subunit n=1 Tax=Flavisolibacter ginsengisoli DSM 18119 TaxID=1121884 RepID=A0A1M5FRZ7_9BACT|nr:restriction endonuclease subunit S [Flavisolibacter ginsengisoli]SHF94278.1 type I restriction enzyme, S subunit [Flavisolibacter ginsengisoli DSM 18119]